MIPFSSISRSRENSDIFIECLLDITYVVLILCICSYFIIMYYQYFHIDDMLSDEFFFFYFQVQGKLKCIHVHKTNKNKTLSYAPPQPQTVLYILQVVTFRDLFRRTLRC